MVTFPSGKQWEGGSAGQSPKASRQESWVGSVLRLGRDKVLALGSLLNLREAVGFPFLFC